MPGVVGVLCLMCLISVARWGGKAFQNATCVLEHTCTSLVMCSRTYIGSGTQHAFQNRCAIHPLYVPEHISVLERIMRSRTDICSGTYNDCSVRMFWNACCVPEPIYVMEHITGDVHVCSRTHHVFQNRYMFWNTSGEVHVCSGTHVA